MAAAAEQAAVVVLFWGDPGPYIEVAHRAGALVAVQVGSAREARAAAAAGADAVIAQGVEAGSHVRGTTPVWELLPQMVAAVAPLPVLASGGIGDGAGLARALRAGTRTTRRGCRRMRASTAGSSNPNYDLHDCIGAAPNASDGNDRAYLSHPSRCFGVSYQSWKYQQDGSKPIYRFVNRFAELAYGRTDVLTMLSKRDGAYLYAKAATALPSGAYAHWSIYAVGTCNPC